MMLAIIGTPRSDEIRRRIAELAAGVRKMHLGILEHRALSYDDRLSEVCDDSLWLQDFILAVEDEYDITINMRETVELETVSDLVELIESKTK